MMWRSGYDLTSVMSDGVGRGIGLGVPIVIEL